MVLWKYEDKGYTKYRLSTVDENCPDCMNKDGKTMMLVPSDLHNEVRHTGGAALIRKGIRP